MNYKSYYYYFFYLLFFEERKVLCVSRRIKKRHEYFKVDFNDCIDIKILKLFFLLIDKSILAVDFSLKKWSSILFQIDFETNKNYFSHYKNDFWTMFELKYNITKRECCELLKTLKKVRFWLYKMQFIIEINVNILITQLNRSAVDFSEILMIRWLTWIHLFDFNIRYVFDKRYIAINELF